MDYGTYPVSTRAGKGGEGVEHQKKLASIIIGKDNPDSQAFGDVRNTEYEKYMVTALDILVQALSSGNGSGTLKGFNIGGLSGGLLY